MPQAQKKSNPHPSAKLASNVANKAAKQTIAAVESTRNSAENVVRMSSTAMKDFISSSAGEAQKAHEKAFAFSREGAENMAKSMESMSHFMSEMVAMSRDNIETCIECGNMAASMAKDISSDAFEGANKAFSDSVEVSREFFACRTFNDMFELQNRIGKNAMDNFFNHSMKFSNKFFEYSSDALEPINERVSQATEQLNKAFSE